MDVALNVVNHFVNILPLKSRIMALDRVHQRIIIYNNFNNYVIIVTVVEVDTSC